MPFKSLYSELNEAKQEYDQSSPQSQYFKQLLELLEHDIEDFNHFKRISIIAEGLYENEQALKEHEKYKIQYADFYKKIQSSISSLLSENQKSQFIKENDPLYGLITTLTFIDEHIQDDDHDLANDLFLKYMDMVALYHEVCVSLPFQRERNRTYHSKDYFNQLWTNLLEIKGAFKNYLEQQSEAQHVDVLHDFEHEVVAHFVMLFYCNNRESMTINKVVDMITSVIPSFKDAFHRFEAKLEEKYYIDEDTTLEGDEHSVVSASTTSTETIEISDEDSEGSESSWVDEEGSSSAIKVTMAPLQLENPLNFRTSVLQTFNPASAKKVSSAPEELIAPLLTGRQRKILLAKTK
jgi:hypothetical protein